jgi:HK97 family phage major capsid protein
MECLQMTVAELKERAVAEAKEARAIKDKTDQEGRGMNPEEVDAFNKHLREATRVEQEADRQAQLEATELRLNKPQERQVKPELADGGRIEVVGAPKLYRAGQLRAFKGPKADINAYNAGRWLMGAVMNDQASRQYCRDRGIEIRVQTEGVNTAGGFVVPDTMEQAVIDLREEYGDFRRNCRVTPMSSDHMYIPRRSGGVTPYFVGETTEITASDKSWNQVELTAKKLAAMTRLSTDLSEDAIISIADDLTDEMAYAFAVKEDQCGIDGDGTSTYGGMVGLRPLMIDGAHLGGWITGAACDNYTEITAAMLGTMMGALPKYAKKNAKWYCSPTCKAAVFDRLALAMAGNNAASIAAGAAPRYCGYDIVEMAAMPSTDGVNTVIMFLFGDLRKSSTLGDRRGITIKVSDQRYIEYDQIGIQATERFCIVNHDIGGAAATTRGPIIGWLATA